MAVPAAMRVLVTGAGGFVGRWLIPALAQRLPGGSPIVGTLRDAGEALVPPAEPDVLDVTDAAAVDAAIARHRPDVVVHLAAIAAVTEARRDLTRTYDVNLGGTLNMAQAVLRHVPEARFLFIGTAEVYGASQAIDGTPTDEAALLAPMNGYAASKAAADLLVGQLARDGLKAVRLRPFNHTGPGQTEHFAIPAFAAQIARIEAGLQEPVIRVGNLEARRDFLDVRDVVAAYAEIATTEAFPPPGTILNVASGVTHRLGDVLDALVARARVPIRLEQDPARLRANDTPVSVGDARRLRTLTGWAPTIPFEHTLADVLDAWRSAVGTS